MGLKAKYQRFNQFTWQQQLGHLASTLARTATQVEVQDSDQVVMVLLREAILQIEWSAPNVPDEYRLELAAMQREVIAWQRRWPVDDARSLLALHTRNQANRLLQMAGLLEADVPSAG
jgi:hypothetical protein